MRITYSIVPIQPICACHVASLQLCVAVALSVGAHLDLCKVSLLLAKANLANLGVDQHTDDSGLLPQLLQVSLNALAAITVLLAVVAESLLLALVPAKHMD